MVRKEMTESRVQAPPRAVGRLRRGLPGETIWDMEKESTCCRKLSRRARKVEGEYTA